MFKIETRDSFFVSSSFLVEKINTQVLAFFSLSGALLIVMNLSSFFLSF